MSRGLLPGRGERSRRRGPVLVADSPLRRADPRAKLALSLGASLAVMLALDKLALFALLYIAFLWWAKLLPEVARQIWRMRWILLFLFLGDWVIVNLGLAATVTLRLALLAGVFTLFVGTTSPSELRQGLERLRVPSRYAFSLSLAFQSLDLMAQEWQAIREAQMARGIRWPRRLEPSGVLSQIGGLVALTVPAIILATRRAWAMTEAAYARGFDSPHRRPYQELRLGWFDAALLVGSLTVGAALIAL